MSIENQEAFSSIRLSQCLVLVLNVYGLHGVVAIVLQKHWVSNLDAGWHTDYIRNKSCENTRTLCQIHCCISDSAILHFAVMRCTAAESLSSACIRLHRIPFALLLIYFSQASMFSSLLKTLRKRSVRYKKSAPLKVV